MDILKVETINLPWFCQLLANPLPNKQVFFQMKMQSSTLKV